MDTCNVSIEDCKLPINNYNNHNNYNSLDNDENNWSKKKYLNCLFTIILSTLIAGKILYYLLFDILLK